jgi:hypothetical protein
MSRKDDSGYTVDVKVDPGYQIDDGTSKIKATATVTYNNQPVTTTRIDWKIVPGNMSAIFQNGQNSWAGVTDKNGQSVATITDTKPEGGQVVAFITLNNGDTPSGQDAFHFIPAVPDSITLELLNNGVYADSGKYIKAIATPIWKGKPYPRPAPIYFQIVVSKDSETQFYDSDGPNAKPLGHTATISTGGGTDPASGGDAVVYIKGPMWEKATCDAWWSPGDNDQPYASQVYVINTPVMDVEFNPLTTPADDTKHTICECNQSTALAVAPAEPANGGFTATAKIFDNLPNQPLRRWLEGGDAIFTLPSPGPTPIIPAGSGITAGDNPGQYRVPIDKKTGTAALSFWDSNVEQGSISAYVPGLDDKPSGNTASSAYTFSDPWHGVSSATIQYSGTHYNAWVYDNGRQQAEVLVTLALVDRNSNPLTDAQMPSATVVQNAVKLLNYQTGEELGTGSSTMWSYSTTPNDYDKETITDLFDAAQKNSARPVPARATSNNGTITLTYYVTCNNNGTGGSVSFGVQVTPTGGHIDLTGNIDPRTQVPIGVFTPGEDPTKYWLGGKDHKLSPTTNLIAKTPPVYTLDKLDIVPSHTAHADEDDQGPKVAGIDKEGNYWRQWDYTISISSNPQKNTFGTRLVKAQLASGFDYYALVYNGYNFAEKSNATFYDYKGYLWPTNLKDVSGNDLPLNNGTAVMNAEAAQDQTYTFPGAGGSPLNLYVTLYMAFAGRPISRSANNAVNLYFYDNCGTRAQYRFDNTNLPQSYNTTVNANVTPPSLPDWKPLTFISGNFAQEESENAFRGERWSAPPPRPAQRWEGEPVPSLGTIYLYNQQANQPIVSNGKGKPEAGYCLAIIDSVGTDAATIERVSAAQNEGDSRYASTSLLYMANVNIPWYYLVNVPDFGGGLDPNIVIMTGARDQDENSRCLATPIWYNQTVGIVFKNTQQYLYYPGGPTSPGHKLDSRNYVYVGAFIKGDNKYQWTLVNAGT